MISLHVYLSLCTSGLPGFTVTALSKYATLDRTQVKALPELNGSKDFQKLNLFSVYDSFYEAANISDCTESKSVLNFIMNIILISCCNFQLLVIIQKILLFLDQFPASLD
jgi:hypothetical protein